jgi:hypothetical protein
MNPKLEVSFQISVQIEREYIPPTDRIPAEMKGKAAITKYEFIKKLLWYKNETAQSKVIAPTTKPISCMSLQGISQNRVLK